MRGGTKRNSLPNTESRDTSTSTCLLQYYADTAAYGDTYLSTTHRPILSKTRQMILQILLSLCFPLKWSCPVRNSFKRREWLAAAMRELNYTVKYVSYTHKKTKNIRRKRGDERKVVRRSLSIYKLPGATSTF